MKKKVFNILSLICNLFIVISVICSIITFFVSFNGQPPLGAKECFKFFTNDSNILCALACAILIPYNIMILCNKKEAIPKWANIVKLVGTTALTITLLTVILFLGPTQGYTSIFKGINLFLHLLCPLLAIISYLFFEIPLTKINWRYSTLGLLPTLIYGIVYMVMVVAVGEGKGGWNDFYGFNAGGLWYVSGIVMLLVTLGISVGLFFLQRVFKKAIFKEKR